MYCGTEAPIHVCGDVWENIILEMETMDESQMFLEAYIGAVLFHQGDHSG